MPLNSASGAGFSTRDTGARFAVSAIMDDTPVRAELLTELAPVETTLGALVPIELLVPLCTCSRYSSGMGTQLLEY